MLCNNRICNPVKVEIVDSSQPIPLLHTRHSLSDYKFVKQPAINNNNNNNLEKSLNLSMSTKWHHTHRFTPNKSCDICEIYHSNIFCSLVRREIIVVEVGTTCYTAAAKISFWKENNNNSFIENFGVPRCANRPTEYISEWMNDRRRRTFMFI